MYAHEPDERVLYAPPKSVAFGHQSRIRDPRIAWPKALQFFDEFALYRLEPYITLDCYGLSQSTSEAVVAERLDTARQLFGVEKNPSTVPLHTRSWELQPEQLSVAIGFALDDDKWPKQDLGPVSLVFRYRILWRDLLTSPLPSGEGLQRLPLTNDWSRFGIFLGGQRLFIQPDLVFPFHYLSTELAAFLIKIEGALPFRFRDQYFKRLLTPKNKGAHGRVLKLDRTWRQPNLGLQRTPTSGRC